MDTTEEVLSLAPKIMRTCFLGLFLVSISVLTSYYLQALLKRGLASLVSSLRGIILPVLFAFALPAILGYEGIWWAIPLSEFITATVCVILILLTSKTKNASK